MEPKADHPDIPAVYGKPKTLLDWASVRELLEKAERYWLATTRKDGRPHVIPIDGMWIDDVWYFGGDPKTVHQRTVKANPNIVVHLEDAMKAVIVEGTAEWILPSDEDAKRLADANNAKYGYGMTPAQYSKGTWGLKPKRVIAWTEFLADATRFRFD